MSRQTVAGEATATLLCERFGISRQAYYAAQKPAARRRTPSVARLPAKPRYAPAETVLAAIGS